VKRGRPDARRFLRMRQARSEQIFWELVRDRRFAGLKFRRQYAIAGFVTDFYCARLKLAVELDGGIHQSQTERDHARDGLIAHYGIRVVRITNDELANDPNEVLVRLRSLIWQPRIAPSPSPSDGEGDGG